MATESAAIDAARVVAADDEPESWLAHGRTYDEQRFSPLDQVNEGNIGDLALTWTYDTDGTSISPDGDWLALLNGDLLSKVPVGGGEPIPLADLRGHDASGISWGSKDDSLTSANDGLYRLFASDPKLERVTHLDEDAGEVDRPRNRCGVAVQGGVRERRI